ncbi:hypothetical protein TUM4644_27820 [Shewanella colwelliana]|nr:hypothetical protein TUM4644_27820 [Shewanella colwelliana]
MDEITNYTNKVKIKHQQNTALKHASEIFSLRSIITSRWISCQHKDDTFDTFVENKAQEKQLINQVATSTKQVGGG